MNSRFECWFIPQRKKISLCFVLFCFCLVAPAFFKSISCFSRAWQTKRWIAKYKLLRPAFLRDLLKHIRFSKLPQRVPESLERQTKENHKWGFKLLRRFQMSEACDSLYSLSPEWQEQGQVARAGSSPIWSPTSDYSHLRSVTSL